MDFFRDAFRQYSHHRALWPLIGSCMLASSFTTYILIRSSKKQEVEWNRYADRSNKEAIIEDAIARPMQRVQALSVNTKAYQTRPPTVPLLQVIYEDGEYNYPKNRSA
ncbi:uncharacterized protein LOC120328731 [Styela clava]